MTFSISEYKKLIDAMTTAQTNDEKGRSLEDLIQYLMERIPGIEIGVRDVRGDIEEIDFVLLNEQIDPFIKSWENVILVECKNWSKKVGASEVEWFIHKLRRRGLTNGILIAAEGITGDEQRAAGALIMEALKLDTTD
jgi:predicted helicase